MLKLYKLIIAALPCYLKISPDVSSTVRLCAGTGGKLMRAGKTEAVYKLQSVCEPFESVYRGLLS